MYYNQPQQQQQQGQPLQADPRQQTVPSINIQPGNPHFLPNVDCAGQLQPYFPHIVTALMLEVQQKAPMNAARMYAFNFMGQNNFMTVEFTNLCQLTVDYFDAIMRAPNCRTTIDQCINDVIPDLVGKYCLALTAYYPDLYGFLDANTVQYVNPAIQSMGQIGNMVAMSKQQAMYTNNGIQQQVIGGRMTGNWATTGGGGYQQNLQQRPIAHAAALGGGNLSADRLFNDQPKSIAPTPMTQAPIDGGMSRFARQSLKRAEEALAKQNAHKAVYHPVGVPVQANGDVSPGNSQPITRVAKTSYVMPKPTSAGPSQVQPQPVPVNIQPIVTKPLPVQEAPQLVWRPSDAQPHKPIFDFTKFKSELVDVDGDVVEVLQELTPEEKENMNVEDHAMTRVPLPRYDATATTPEAEPVTDRIIEVPVFALDFSDEILLEINSTVTATITGLRYAVNKIDNDRAAAKCYPTIIVDTISIEDVETAKRHKAIIEQIGACDSFEKAVAILDGIRDNKDDRMFFNRLNRLLTQELNNVLVMNFGSFWFDDFYTDVMEVLPAIAKKRGNVLYQTFLSKQRLFFKQFYMSVSREQLERNTAFLHEEYINNPDENPTAVQGDFVVVPWETSFTHMNIPSYELNINLKPGETGTLSEESTPELWSLADQILNNDQCKNGRRHYLITGDGIQFLLARGYIRDDAYLVRRVREVA